MDIQDRRVRVRFLPKLIAIVAACAILMGCDDNGPTAPTTTRVAPTPVPIPNIAGNWQGHSRTQGPAYFCGGDVPASATFAQDGALVTGRVTTTRVERAFQGEFRGSQLSGSLTSSGSTTSVTGSAGATYVTLRHGGGGAFFCGMTTISLVR